MRSATADQRGMVLPLTLMFIMILTTLSVALLTVGGQESQIAVNHLRGVHALFLAEAGLEDAFNSFQNTSSLLTGATSSLTTLTGSGPGTSLTAYGGYTIQYQSAGSNTVRVISTGWTGSSSSHTSERVVRALLSTGFTSNVAVLTKESMTTTGNVEIEGTCGSIHSNANLTMTGNVEIDHNATASGTESNNGNVQVGGTQASNQPTKTIPTVSAATALSSAQSSLSSGLYQMMSDGRVLDKDGNLLTTVTNNNTYLNWKYNSGTTATWSVTGNTGSTGTFYIQGNATISGGPGSSSSRWQVSVIATGDITISGNPYITNHLTDTLLIAGGDIKISGNPDMKTGVIATHEQIEISGNPEITGYVLAEGGASSSSTVTANKISGNAEITYSCGLNPPLQGPLTILASGF